MTKRNDDIVAFLVDGRFLVRRYEPREDVRVITRGHMRLLACMDLNPRFLEFAEAAAIARFKPGRSTDTLRRIRP